MNVEIGNVLFKYRAICTEKQTLFEKTVELPGVFSTQQGRVVGIIGPRGEGKGTIIKLLGGVVLPDAGVHLFIPTHLRVLHVTAEPLFFHGTLYKNLTLGLREGHPNRAVPHIAAILEVFGLSKNWIEEILGAQFSLAWMEV